MEVDVEVIKSLIAEQLEPALKERCQEMQAVLVADQLKFQKDIRAEVRHDHAENRTRLQMNHAASTEAVAIAKSTLGTATRTEQRVDDLYEVLSEIREMVGRTDGERVAEERFSKAAEVDFERKGKIRERRMKWVQWIIGIGTAAGGACRWVYTHFHNGGR